MTPTDSFPRQHARTQRFTLGAPRNVTVAPDGARVAFLRSAGPEDPVTSLWVLDVASGTERVVADPARCSPVTRRPPARGAGPARAGAGERGGHHRLRHRCRPPRGGRRPGRAARRRRPRRAAPPRWSRCRRGDRPPARPHRHAGGVGRRAPALGRRARRPVLGPGPRRRGRPRGALGRGRVHRRRGDGPVPRLLVGARRHGAARHPGRRHAGAAVVDRRPRAPRPAPDGGRLPRGRHPERRRHRLDRAARRRSHRGARGTATTSRTSRRPPGTTTARSSRCTRATSDGSRCAAPTPRSGATEGLWTDRDDVWVERAPGTPARLADGRL